MVWLAIYVWLAWQQLKRQHARDTHSLPYWLEQIAGENALPPDSWMEPGCGPGVGMLRCRGCRLRFSTVKAARLHRDGARCLDLMTARTERGRPIMSIVYEDPGTAEPIWGWPRGLADGVRR